MRCKRIQDLILTDFLDGEIEETERKKLLLHLTECVHCQEFLDIVKDSFEKPFRSVVKLEPEFLLWYKIRRLLEEEKMEKEKYFHRSIFAKVRERLQVIIPALAITSILIGIVFTDIDYLRLSSNYKENHSKLEIINNGINFETLEDTLLQSVNFETAIEEYFL